MLRILAVTTVCIATGACVPDKSTPASQPTQWPTELPVFGDAYPDASSSCRRVGENALTNPYLGDDSRLFACLKAADAARLGGTVVTTIRGVSVVSVPGRG